MLRVDARCHTAHTPGELIERVDGDVATLARFFSRFVVSVLGNGLLLLGVLGLLYHVDWRVGAAMRGFFLLAPLCPPRFPPAPPPPPGADRPGRAAFPLLLRAIPAGRRGY